MQLVLFEYLNDLFQQKQYSFILAYKFIYSCLNIWKINFFLRFFAPLIKKNQGVKLAIVLTLN